MNHFNDKYFLEVINMNRKILIISMIFVFLFSCMAIWATESGTETTPPTTTGNESGTGTGTETRYWH